jgi:5-methylcytosine-specific restriction enzyme subunit McrC
VTVEVARDVVELREWESVARPDCDLVSDRDRRLANQLRGDQRLVVDELRQGLRLTATSWVGVVRFDQFEARVVPKLAGGPLGLIEMVVFAAGLNTLRRFPGLRELATEERALLDLIALLFAEATSRVLQVGLLRDYVAREDDLAVVRGRILVREQVLRRLGRADRVVCRFDEHETDILENRLITAALRACRGRVRDEEVRRRLATLQAVFEPLCDLEGLDLAASRAAIEYHRLNDHYRDAHALAWLLLDGLGTRDPLATGDTRCFAFLLDMNQLFERVIFRTVERLLAGTSNRVRAQVGNPSVIWDAIRNRPYARMIPDLLVEGGPFPGRQLALDAKYKRYDARRLETGDIYQSFLYAYAYSRWSATTVSEAVLVHPADGAEPTFTRLRIRTAAEPAGAQIVAVGVPIAALLEELAGRQPERVLAALRRTLLLLLAQGR